MNEIDWSKAPEGCIGAFTSKNDSRSVGFSPFFVITKRYSDYGDQAGCSGEDQDGKEYHVFEKYWDYHEKPASWSGEGLPPVGVVCEVKQTARCAEREWFKAEVLYSSHYTVVLDDYQAGEFVSHPCTLQFRPIRTPEQIAADEREAAIDAMLAATPAPGSDISLRVCEQLYDAGYRKP